jgi:hypothetical protein
MKPINAYICGCVRNCEKHLQRVFKNIQRLATLFDQFRIVMAYDISEDNTFEVLKQWASQFAKDQMIILVNHEYVGPIRTQNISNGRNAILRYMRREDTPQFEYFMMIDMDEVCAGEMNIDLLRVFLDKERAEETAEWDALTFNRRLYYDAWALSIRPYIFSCWNFTKGGELVEEMRKYVQSKLKEVAEISPKYGLLRCESAFNGFGFYRSAKFDGITYEWDIHKNIEIIPREWIRENIAAVGRPAGLRETPDDCEHRYFHMRATQVNGARICISPLCLF